jgi:hypothetical protein
MLRKIIKRRVRKTEILKMNRLKEMRKEKRDELKNSPLL